MPTPFLKKNNKFSFKQISLAWVHSLNVKIFLFQAIQFSQTVLILPIQFSICTEFVYTQLNLQTVLFQVIQLSFSTHFSSFFFPQ